MEKSKNLHSDENIVRLLIISPGGMGSHYHGPATALYRLLTIIKNRIRADVLHCTDDQKGISPIHGKAIRAGRDSSTAWSQICYIFAVSRFIFFNRKRYDVLIVAKASFQTLVPSAISSLLGMHVILRVAAIAEIRNERRSYLKSRIKTRLLRQASAYLAISNEIADQLYAEHVKKGRVHFIPNSVDTDRFTPVGAPEAHAIASDLGLDPSGRIRLVCVGAVCDRKGQLHIVKALARLPKDVSLLLVGPVRDTRYFREIAEVSKALGVAERVVHIPFMETIEMAYKAGDIFVLPSAGEGMPSAMLEAMASGLVPIGTNTSGIQDLVSEDCGHFVTRDPTSIAETINMYLRDREMISLEGKRARIIITKNFSAQHAAETFYSLVSQASIISSNK